MKLTDAKLFIFILLLVTLVNVWLFSTFFTKTSESESSYSAPVGQDNNFKKGHSFDSPTVNLIRGDKITHYDMFNVTNLDSYSLDKFNFELVLRGHDIKAVLVFSDHRTGSSQLMHRLNQCGPLNFWELFKQENTPDLIQPDLTYQKQKDILLNKIYHGDRIWKLQSRQYYDFYYVANDVFQEENIFFIVNERLDLLDKCFSWTNIAGMAKNRDKLEIDRGNIWNGVEKDEKKGLKQGINEEDCMDRQIVNDFYFDNIKKKLDIYKKSYMVINYENTHQLERILDIDLTCISELK